MRVLSKKTLRDFWEGHSDAKTPLEVWYYSASNAKWSKPQDIKDEYGKTVDFVSDSRVVWDIGGNKYRLVVRVVYDPHYRVLIKWVGTHAEYNKIDVETV
jgi:mRNA interferase HigB